MSKIDFLNMGIFPGTVLFSCGNTFDELTTQINKNYNSGKWKPEIKGFRQWSAGLQGDKQLIENGTYISLRRDLENEKKGLSKRLFYIIITKQFKFTDYEMCKLAHECLHICQFHLKDILDRNKEIEAEAYLHTHLMSQCLKILRS